MKTAQYGTAIAIIHAIVHGLHGLAHAEIPIPLSLIQSSFVAMVILLAPMLAASLLWTKFDRIGSWLFLGSMLGSLVFGIYNHMIAISPDHVLQVAFTGWGLLFQITAILTLIVDGLGSGIGIGMCSFQRLEETV
jgi:hypothetical protein